MQKVEEACANSFGQNFCRDSTLPVCNVRLPALSSSKLHNADSAFTQLFPGFKYNDSGLKSCVLEGIPLKNGNHLGNLGSLHWIWL
jgi:hypothetical protein